ncbi:hypothetical protein V5F59_05895 [Xanthobacter autotrophicus DSM 431]|uniref:hypothetical protein n=1 Tax=Xanthobacter nonsaccharivorans TaxID=3119912 RepID=UPI003728F946
MTRVMWRVGGTSGTLLLWLVATAGMVAVAQTSVTLSKRVINLPVIPQGNYLDPGPGPAIRPDVKIGDDRNEDYAFPPDLSGGYGSGPPGDPTVNGQWSPLDGDTPSF